MKLEDFKYLPQVEHVRDDDTPIWSKPLTEFEIAEITLQVGARGRAIKSKARGQGFDHPIRGIYYVAGWSDFCESLFVSRHIDPETGLLCGDENHYVFIDEIVEYTVVRQK